MTISDVRDTVIAKVASNVVAAKITSILYSGRLHSCTTHNTDLKNVVAFKIIYRDKMKKVKYFNEKTGDEITTL